MKWQHALLGLVTVAGALQADINDDVYSGDSFSSMGGASGQDEIQGPITLRTSFDYFGKAKITKRPYNGEKFRFDEFDVDGSYVFYYNKCRDEGLSLEAGYSRFTMDWNQNPFFHQDHFDMVSVGLGFFTKRAWRWDWKGVAKMNFNPDHLDFQNYVTWDLLLWGRYELSSDWGFHTGVLALTGMKIDRIYPILGVDWTFSERWKFNAVFPMNFSIVYTWDCHWSFALGSRFWDVRQRVGNGETLKRAIWEYRNVGGELVVSYKRDGWYFDLHAGYATGGQLRICDKNNKHANRLDFEGAPYVGAEAAVNF